MPVETRSTTKSSTRPTNPENTDNVQPSNSEDKNKATQPTDKCNKEPLEGEESRDKKVSEGDKEQKPCEEEQGQTTESLGEQHQDKEQQNPKQEHPKQDHPKQEHPEQWHPEQWHPKQEQPKQEHPEQWHPKQQHPERWHPKQDHPKQEHPERHLKQQHPEQWHPKQQHPEQQHPKQQVLSYNSLVVLLSVVLLVVAVVVATYSNKHNSTIQPSHPISQSKTFTEKLEKMRKSFPNQTERFWLMIKKISLAHLEMANPNQPLVMLLSGPPSAYNVINCIAKMLAESLDDKSNHSSFIDSTEYKEKDGDYTKQSLDDKLEDLINNGHKSALIMNIETLPAPAPMLFYRYCDGDNSAFKDVAILFTVHLPEEISTSLKPVDAEGKVEIFLKGLWKGPPYKRDDIQPLMSRIAETIVLVRGEEQDTVNRECATYH